MLTSIEICAGAGGQALGLERAGFSHVALVENDPAACETLRQNRPRWTVHQVDVRRFSAPEVAGGLDLLAGGVPCPPFSVAGQRLGPDDERDLFPEILRLTAELRPRAVMIENVRGILDAVFDAYRDSINERFAQLGYLPRWALLNASDYGVPQLRPRVVCVAMSEQYASDFEWPDRHPDAAPTVGQVLGGMMAEGGWGGAAKWAASACRIAPTLVGGSKKHGGPDLGPTRAKRAWSELGVDGMGIADEPPGPSFVGLPRLTVAMAARIQGFPRDWVFSGRKTAAYRQVGNAFPPPVAEAVGRSVAAALTAVRAESRASA